MQIRVLTDREENVYQYVAYYGWQDGIVHSTVVRWFGTKYGGSGNKSARIKLSQECDRILHRLQLWGLIACVEFKAKTGRQLPNSTIVKREWFVTEKPLIGLLNHIHGVEKVEGFLLLDERDRDEWRQVIGEKNEV